MKDTRANLNSSHPPEDPTSHSIDEVTLRYLDGVAGDREIKALYAKLELSAQDR